MTIDFRWDNDEHTVLRLVAQGTWNWNDFHRHLQRASLWLDTVSHPVDTIIDLRASHRLPAGALGHIRSLGKSTHPNAAPRVVIIGLDAGLAAQLGGADGIYRAAERELRFVTSDEAAQAVIRDWRAADQPPR